MRTDVAGRENSQDVKAKRGRELEPGEDEDVLQKATVLGQTLPFAVSQTVQPLQKLELFDLVFHCPVAGHGIVVGKGQDVHLALVGLLEDI